MSRETDEEKIAAEFQERKESIARLLLDATTRNFPPMKKDISEIFAEIKKLFPELETLKELAVNKESGRISRFWWDMAHIYGINKKIEQEIEKKPFNSKRAGEVFAYVLWLSFELLFKKDLLELGQEGRPYEKFKQAQRQLRAERIVLNILLLNARFKIATGLDDVWVFKENVPSFFAKLPTQCTGQDDFSGRILSLGSIFEVNLETLRKIVPNVDRKSSSIKIIQKWLEKKGITDQKGVIDVWGEIRLLRNAPPTHPRISPKQLEALAFFGESSSVNFTALWDSILDKFAESLEQFQEIVTTVS